MKNTFIVMLSIFILLSTSLVSGIYLSDQINQTYYFEKPSIDTIDIEGITYHQIHMSGLQTVENPGKPCLPVKGVYLLLPYQSKVDSITITVNNPISLGKDYLVKPASTPVPLSYINLSEPPSPDKKIYNSSSIYPGTLYSMIGTYWFRGYQILVLNLHPVQYKPTTGEILYYSSMTVNIKLSEESSDTSNLRNKISDLNEIKTKIDNPSLLSTYPNLYETSNEDNYNYLILTTSDFQNGFLPLKEVQDERGIRTKIKTLRDINIIPNQVNPEYITSFIRQEYQNYGIEYVLLGGDADIIPAKMLYVYGLDEGKWPEETILPSDLYYSCLDGTYNYDGDELWGEPTDGENGEDVDLYAEVYIGRACVDSTDDVANFVDKTISYLTINPSSPYLDSYLMAGEYLGNYGVASWGGNYLDLLIDNSSIDDYTTKGIPSDKFTIEKLYDRDNEWSSEDILNYINDGVHVINHDGHSYYGYNMKLVNDHVSYFTNDEYFFAYSVGCMAGGFDDPEGYDCFAEYITVKTDHGAFATIMNARYGWFWAFSTDGDGTRFTREFWDAIFGENIPVISKANQDSKEDNIHIIDRSCIRWTLYELNLFGDPTISLHISKPPNVPDKPTGPSSGKIDQVYTFTTKTIDIANDQVYYQFDWGNNDYSDWIGPYQNNEMIEMSHSWSKEGTYQIRVKAKDDYGAESTWSEPLEVSMPKNKDTHLFWQYHLLERILQILNQFFI